MPAKYIKTKEATAKVKEFAQSGVTQRDIAAAISVSINTLRKHYKDELNRSRAVANQAVAGMLYEQCKKGNVTAQIFWLKTRGGWRESVESASTNNEVSKVDIQIVDSRKKSR